MKYKVGDRVRVKRDLEVDASYGGMEFVLDMVKFKGEVLTIKAIDSRDGTYRAEGVPYFWSEEMLEDAPVTLNLIISSSTNYSMHIYNEYDMHAVLNTLEATIREELKPKGKYIPKVGEGYYYVSAFGCILKTINSEGNGDKYILNNSLVFRTEEEARDYKLFKEQVAELRKPFVIGKDNLYYYYAFDWKSLEYTLYSTVFDGAPIFGYTIEEIEKAREILGYDRIKKYLLDIWE